MNPISDIAFILAIPGIIVLIMDILHMDHGIMGIMIIMHTMECTILIMDPIMDITGMGIITILTMDTITIIAIIIIIILKEADMLLHPRLEEIGIIIVHTQKPIVPDMLALIELHRNPLGQKLQELQLQR